MVLQHDPNDPDEGDRFIAEFGRRTGDRRLVKKGKRKRLKKKGPSRLWQGVASPALFEFRQAAVILMSIVDESDRMFRLEDVRIQSKWSSVDNHILAVDALKLRLPAPKDQRQVFDSAGVLQYVWPDESDTSGQILDELNWYIDILAEGSRGVREYVAKMKQQGIRRIMNPRHSYASVDITGRGFGTGEVVPEMFPITSERSEPEGSQEIPEPIRAADRRQFPIRDEGSDEGRGERAFVPDYQELPVTRRREEQIRVALDAGNTADELIAAGFEAGMVRRIIAGRKDPITFPDAPVQIRQGHEITDEFNIGGHRIQTAIEYRTELEQTLDRLREHRAKAFAGDFIRQASGSFAGFTRKGGVIHAVTAKLDAEIAEIEKAIEDADKNEP